MAPKPPALTRDQAMNAKPVAARVVAREPLPGGGERIKVPFHPSGVYKWLLRVPETATKRFDLDPMGVEVLAMCDGQKSVRYIAQRFAKTHSLNPHEAEQAVVAFIQMMMRKGIVSVVVD
ncbi:MAG: PqqD family protein [Planctomycetes bacterium]|nr:PqqD family protein [Planctomycetota bacterium]